MERWARRPTTGQALAMRCRTVLGAATGATNQQIAVEVGCNPTTVGKWRDKYPAMIATWETSWNDCVPF